MQRKVRAIEPMQPMTLPKGQSWDFSRPGWLYQIKYDGYRGILSKSSKGCALESKESKDLLRQRTAFRKLSEHVAAQLRAKSIVLDGEVAVLDEQGRADFWALMKGRGSPVYVAFDVLQIEGADVRHLPLEERLMLLRGQLPKEPNGMLMADPVDGRLAEKVFKALCSKQLDVEGLVAKKLGSPYDPRRKDAWQKVLNPNYSQAEPKRAFFNKAHATKTAR